METPTRIHRFVEERQRSGGVSAVLLYGSYARGTQHEKSDVDIIFVIDEGFKRDALVYEGLLFEILEATKDSIVDFWQKNFDEDRHWYLWKDVKVLFDRDGEGSEIVEKAMALVEERNPWPHKEIEMRKLVMLERLEKVRYLSSDDPGTAGLLLADFVQTLLGNWFQLRGRFVPSPKEFFAIFAKEDPHLKDLLHAFWVDPEDLASKFDQVDVMLKAIYKNA